MLVVDVGGTSVKILATGQTEGRSFASGPRLTPARMASGHSDSIALYSGQLWINNREGLEPKLRIDVKKGGAYGLSLNKLDIPLGCIAALNSQFTCIRMNDDSQMTHT